MLSTQVEWPEDTEILLADMPPSTASEVFSFFDNMSGLLGCLIVTQPSEISALGMTRTIDFLRHKQIPIMGLVTMMDGYLCPHCGKVSHQLLSPKLAMEKVARECGVPFLISIPQTPDVGLLKPYFDRLAKMILKCRPITLRKQTLRQQLQQMAGELGVKAAGKFM
jgi:Mrp family chromosome partitioning ATPase